MKIDILAIGVHPDDIELGCGGTILKHIALGHTVGICDLTQGELGTRGTAKIRIQEAKKAQSILGVSCRENLNMEDGYFSHSKENLNKIIHVIRKYRPTIVLANAIHDRHPDHARAAKLTADACFYAGLRKIDTQQEARRPQAVYHYIQDRNIKADILIDISTHIEKKQEAILAYKSQFHDPTSQEPETPISGEHFIDSILAKNMSYARPLGVKYAEGFTVNRTIGVDNFFDII